MLITIIVIVVFWSLLTLFVEMPGPKRYAEFGERGVALNTLIIYDPDPFYNLDQQVCESFAKALSANGWHVQVMSVAAVKQKNVQAISLYVFCANTYNWSPDWAITRYIKKQVEIKDKNVVAITLGAGSTTRSKQVFENIIKNRGGVLLGSHTWWLWRPNDENRLKESNVKLAVELAGKFGNETAKQIADAK